MTPETLRNAVRAVLSAPVGGPSVSAPPAAPQPARVESIRMD
jgi:hypothetical protein